MKKLVLSLLLLVSLTAASVRAATFLPYLAPVRAELTNQLATANSATPVNKKLVSSLNTALKLIDKPGQTNLVNDTKLLTVLIPALKRTAVSTAFSAVVDGAVSNYLAAVYEAAGNSSNALAVTYPSAVHNAAQKNLDAVLALLAKANSTADDAAAAKLISQAATKLATTDKLVTRAAKAPAPPAGLTATVTGAVKWSYKSTAAVATQVTSGWSLVNSQQAILKSPFGQRTITLGLSGLQPGANVLTVSSTATSFVVAEVYGNGTGAGYTGKSGTVRVTYNPSTKGLVGTFSVQCVDERDSSREITVNGAFSVTTL
jgi:hypothetical protein